MKRNHLCAAGAGAVFFLLLACSGPAVILKDPKAEAKAQIKAGEILSVQLKAQLGTGYSWNYQVEGKAIELSGKPKQHSLEAEKGKSGGWDLQEFLFKGVASGESKIKFTYSEYGKQKGKILNTVFVKVTVK